MSAPRPPLRQSQQQRVLRASKASQWWVWQTLGWFSALLVPLLILIFGVIAKLLEDGGLKQPRLAFGEYLEIALPAFLIGQTPPIQLMLLVGCGALLAWLQAMLLFFYSRGIHRRASELSETLYQMILSASMRVAEGEGISAQRYRTRLLIEDHLAAIQGAVTARWKALPRNLVLGVSCTALAIAVDVWLTLLAILSGAIVWLVYRFLNSVARTQSERFNLTEMRERLTEMVQTAPLVARVRGTELSVEESGGPVGQLIEAARAKDRSRLRNLPILLCCSVLFFSLLLLSLGGKMLAAESVFHLPAALVLLLALASMVTAVIRMTRYLGRRGEFEDASAAFWAFVDRPDTGKTSEKLALAKVTGAVELRDVTMLDGQGNTLLDQVNLHLKPGTMIALLGTDSTAVSTLVELLMGFGNPRAGSVTIDGISIHELHPRWFAKQVLWVGATGPIWTGSIQENLGFADTLPDTGDLAEAARQVGVYERLQGLSDGWTTLISNDDSRIDEGTRYGLAAARAWLRKPSILIVQEPAVQPGLLTDDPAVETFRQLANEGSLVVLLPQRLQTLRQVDRVVLLNDGKIAGEGRHEELLGSSDLYRHLNYTLFNPYRHRQNPAR